MKKLLSFGPLFIVIAALLWSVDGLLRVSLYSLSPIVVVFYEHLIGFFLLLPFLFSTRRKLATIRPKVWGAFAWVTLLSSVIGTLFYTAALGQINYIQFSVVVLLQKLQPIFAVFFAWVVLKEKLDNKYFLWFFVAMIGGYLVAFPNVVVNLETGQGTIFAALLAVGAAFSWGSSTAFSRYALLQLPTVLTTGLRFGLAAIISFAIVIVMNQTATLSTLSQQQWVTLLTIALSTGMVALVIYYYGLKRTPVRIATICELVWPLSAVFLDYVYFHRTLSLTQWLGALLLTIAIYRVSLLQKKK